MLVGAEEHAEPSTGDSAPSNTLTRYSTRLVDLWRRDLLLSRDQQIAKSCVVFIGLSPPAPPRPPKSCPRYASWPPFTSCLGVNCRPFRLAPRLDHHDRSRRPEYWPWGRVLSTLSTGRRILGPASGELPREEILINKIGEWNMSGVRKAVTVWTALIAVVGGYGLAASEKIDIVKQIDTSRQNTHYVSKRRTLVQSPLTKLPIGSVNP